MARPSDRRLCLRHVPNFPHAKDFPKLGHPDSLEEGIKNLPCHLKAILTSLLIAASLSAGVATSADAQSDLFVSINGNRQNGGGFISQYTPSGAQSAFPSPASIGPGGWPSIVAVTCSWPPPISIGSGNISRLQFSRSLPDGTVTTFASAFPSNFFIEGVALDATGNLFVNAEDLSDPSAITGNVFKVLPDGNR